MYKGGSKKELKNNRPVAIIIVVCKLFLVLLRDIINGWVNTDGVMEERTQAGLLYADDVGESGASWLIFKIEIKFMT